MLLFVLYFVSKNVLKTTWNRSFTDINGVTIWETLENVYFGQVIHDDLFLCMKVGQFLLSFAAAMGILVQDGTVTLQNPIVKKSKKIFLELI